MKRYSMLRRTGHAVLQILRWPTPLLTLVTLFALGTPLLAPTTLSAQSDPGQESGGNLLFGQKHAYTIIFRNDGVGTILGRIVLKNTDKEPIKNLSLTIPDVEPSDSVFYQVFAPEQCVEYPDIPLESEAEVKCLRYSNDYLYSNFQYLGNEESTKLSPGREGSTFTIPLSTEVKENEAGGIVFAYRARGYTQEQWSGSFLFTFSTPQVQSPVELVRVAVGVDSDLYLKGQRSKVAYKEQVDAPAELVPASIGRSIDYYQQQGFTKEGRLGSGESLIVKGIYADSWWKLYPWEIIATLAGILLFVLLWLLWRRHYHPAKQQAGPYTGIFTPGNVGVAFASALGTIGLTYLVTYLPEYLNNFGDPISSLLFSIVMLGLYLAVLFGPAISLAFSKAAHGRAVAWQHFLFIVFAELFFLAVLLVVYVNVVPQPGDITPLPYFE